MPNPAAFAVVTQQYLGHRQAHEFAVGQFGSATTAGTGWRHMVVDQHVQCGQEGV